MTETKHPLKVFLCHAHSDKDTVKALYDRLIKDGVDVWLDKEKLIPGQDWELEIRKAVRETDVVVVCLSKQFNQAGFRQKEVRWSLDTAMEKPEGEIFVIPARLEECDTLESLRKWHWVDLFDSRGYEMLTRALWMRAEKIGKYWPKEIEKTKKSLINTKTIVGRRTIEGLKRLKANLDKMIPKRTDNKTLLLSTWNIREFGGSKSGGREDEPLHYIAEIISRFDVIALQEVRENLNTLDQLMIILGTQWKYLVSDIVLGMQGNNERLAYIYNSRKVSFGGVAGTLVPGVQKGITNLKSDFTFTRTPYLASFQTGLFKFMLCCQTSYYGMSKSDDPQHLQEAKANIKLLKQRMKSKDAWAFNTILVGDFNIFSTKDKTYILVEREEFSIPVLAKGVYTNASNAKPFDQIAFLASEAKKQVKLVSAGTFLFFDYVYRDSDWKIYQPDITERIYRQWRTFKMSDHLPFWIEIDIDS